MPSFWWGELEVSTYRKEGKGKGQPLSHCLLRKSREIAPCPGRRSLLHTFSMWVAPIIEKGLREVALLGEEKVRQKIMYLTGFKAYSAVMSGSKTLHQQPSESSHLWYI